MSRHSRLSARLRRLLRSDRGDVPGWVLVAVVTVRRYTYRGTISTAA